MELWVGLADTDMERGMVENQVGIQVVADSEVEVEAVPVPAPDLLFFLSFDESRRNRH
jgi:hypothetical protein